MAEQTEQRYRRHSIEEYYIDQEPFFLPVADEVDLFEAAYSQRVPILLKGPTGTARRTDSLSSCRGG